MPLIAVYIVLRRLREHGNNSRGAVSLEEVGGYQPRKLGLDHVAGRNNCCRIYLLIASFTVVIARWAQCCSS